MNMSNHIPGLLCMCSCLQRSLQEAFWTSRGQFKPQEFFVLWLKGGTLYAVTMRQQWNLPTEHYKHLPNVCNMGQSMYLWFILEWQLVKKTWTTTRYISIVERQKRKDTLPLQIHIMCLLSVTFIIIYSMQFLWYFIWYSHRHSVLNSGCRVLTSLCI